jgi:outer membrane receptor protein involved in Fe transport
LPTIQLTTQGKVVTSGMECEIIYKLTNFDAQVNYSFYKVGDETDLPSFTPVSKKGVFVGFPANKVTFYLNYRLKDFMINSTAYAISERYRVSTDMKDVKENPVFLLNAFIHYIGFKNIDTSIGVMDILDQKYCFLQGYNSGALPMPDASREFLLKINYNLNFK